MDYPFSGLIQMSSQKQERSFYDTTTDDSPIPRDELISVSNRSERFSSHRYIPILIGAKTRRDIHVP
jgi:hypothetical protein